MKNTTAIIILNYKNYQDTINCIHSIVNSKNEDFFIVVVDNASNNNSLQHIEKQISSSIDVQHWQGQTSFSSGVLLVDNKINTGYASGNNVGLRIAYNLGAKYLMVLNNDTLFSAGALEKLKSVVLSDRTVLCSGPLLLKGDGTIDYNCAKRRPTALDFFRFSYFGRWLKTKNWQKKYYYFIKNPKLDMDTQVDIISGSCMLFDADKFRQLDFFDENTFLYYEEAIIHEKARKNSLKLILAPSAKVIHLGAQSTTSHSSSLFTIKCEYNSLKYYLKTYRGFSDFMVSVLSSSSALFIAIYSMKQKLKL